MTSARLRSVRWCWPLLGLCACASNVVLRQPPKTDTGTLGAFQRCESPEKPCRDDKTYDSSRLNAAHTRFFQLPDCPYGIHDIVIEDSGSSDAVVIARCAAPAPTAPAADGGALPLTTEGGETAPAP